MEIDGFLAWACLFLIPVGAWVCEALVKWLDICESLYGLVFGAIVCFSFGIGFALSGLRQRSRVGKVLSWVLLTLIFSAIILGRLLFPAVSG